MLSSLLYAVYISNINDLLRKKMHLAEFEERWIGLNHLCNVVPDGHYHLFKQNLYTELTPLWHFFNVL